MKPSIMNEGTANSSGNVFCNHFRFFILILGTFCLTSIFSNMLTVNFTIICMDSNHRTELNQSNANGSVVDVHVYSQYEKTILQWTVSIASMIATFPFSWLCTQYGAREIFFISGIVSSISTALIPAAANLGFQYFVFIRVFQGLAYACDFAVIGVLCTRWASLKENAKFLGFLTCFSPLASFFTNSFSGIICESSLGWTWVHYFHALASLILFMAWLIFYTDDPKKNRFVTGYELSIIHHNKSEAHKNLSRFVPYLAILKDKVVWSVWLNAFADLFCGFFLFIYAPTYLKKVLKYGTEETGLLFAVVSIIHIPVKMICGYFSDSFKQLFTCAADGKNEDLEEFLFSCMPERQKMWFYNSVAVVTPAFIYIGLCYVPVDIPIITVLMFGAIEAALGFNCGGFYKCGSLVSRQYAEFVIACTQFIKCVVFFVAPALVAIFVTDDSNVEQWHTIFYITAASLMLANTIFCIYATDRPRDFTYITGDNQPSKKENVQLPHHA